MAKNQDRQFSEGENLLPKDLGQSPYETEERLPSWAVKPAEEAAPEKEAPPAGESPDEIRRPLFAAPKAEQADDEPQQAPQRVESAQERRFRDVQEKNEEKNSKKELPVKEKSPKKSPRKNSKKKKKKKGQNDDDRRSFLKSMVIIMICAVLFLGVALMVVSNFVSHPLLTVPKKIITTAITPVICVPV